MRKNLALLVFPAALCVAQSSVTVRGEIKGAAGPDNTFISVELFDVQSHQVVERSVASSDGSFEIRGVRPAVYELRVTTQWGEVLARADADARYNGESIVVTLPDRDTERPAGTSVSVAALRHKPQKAAWKAMRDAQGRSEKNDFEGALRLLRKAVGIDPEFAGARINLGAQLLRLGRPAEAESELRRAVELDPGAASGYSNLALALLLQGRVDEAEPIARRGVRLDGVNARVRCVLGYVLARRPDSAAEAVQHLRVAVQEVPEVKPLLSSLERRLRTTGASAGRNSLTGASGQGN